MKFSELVSKMALAEISIVSYTTVIQEATGFPACNREVVEQIAAKLESVEAKKKIIAEQIDAVIDALESKDLADE